MMKIISDKNIESRISIVLELKFEEFKLLWLISRFAYEFYTGCLQCNIEHISCHRSHFVWLLYFASSMKVTYFINKIQNIFGKYFLYEFNVYIMFLREESFFLNTLRNVFCE